MSVETILLADGSEFRLEFQKAYQSVDALESKLSRTSVLTARDLAKMSSSARATQIEMATLARRSEQVTRAQAGLQRGSKNTGLAFLEVSRAVEDAQYGFRGVLNNLPQIVTLFGGPAGLAAGVSLAAVGFATLVPRLLKTDDAARKAAGGLREAARAAREAREAEAAHGAQAAALAAQAARAAREARLRGASALSNIETFAPGAAVTGGSLRDQLAAESERLARAELFTQRLSAAQAAAAEATERTTRALREEAKELKRVIDLQPDRLIDSAAEIRRVKGFKQLKDFENIEDFADYVRENRAALAGALKKVGPSFKENLQLNIPGGAFPEEALSPRDLSGPVRDLVQQREAQIRLAARLAEVEKLLTAEQEKGSRVTSQYSEDLARLNQIIQAAAVGRKRLQDELAAETLVRQIERLNVPEFELRQTKQKSAAEVKREQEQAAREQAEAAALDRRRDLFAVELRALEAEAAGRADIAGRLRQGVALQEQGLEIAQRLQLTEDKGLSIAARKHKLEQEISEEKARQKQFEEEADESGRRKIRLFDAEASLERRRGRQRGGFLPTLADDAGVLQAGGGRRIGLRQRAEQRARAERVQAAAAQQAKRDPSEILSVAAEDIRASRKALEKLVGGKT